MDQGSSAHYPSVFVVDSHGAYPPVPPRIKRPPQSAKVAQTLLFFLVSLALFGMAIEACFIYRLYHQGPAESATASKVIGEAVPPPTKRPNPVVLPSKPVAHLKANQKQARGVRIMSWSDMDTDKDILYEMKYKDGKLIIQKEGYYYVYSKVYFTERSAFNHCVKVDTPRYLGKPITLLQSRKYSHNSGKGQVRSNSYLGGVFHLFDGDSVFVEVSNTSQIVLVLAYENYFGAYMI